jgi:hypothetical protein
MESLREGPWATVDEGRHRSLAPIPDGRGVLAPSGSAGRPYLVESLILRSRWWVNELGEPDNIYSPRLIVADSDEDAIVSAPAASVGASMQGYASGGK